MNKVILIENHHLLGRTIVDILISVFVPLGSNPKIILAKNVLSAEMMFQNHHHDTDVIFVDAHLEHGDQITTVNLVRKMKRSFRRPIVGISTINEVQWDMMDAGCTHWCDKKDLFYHTNGYNRHPSYPTEPRLWLIYQQLVGEKISSFFSPN